MPLVMGISGRQQLAWFLAGKGEQSVMPQTVSRRMNCAITFVVAQPEQAGLSTFPLASCPGVSPSKLLLPYLTWPLTLEALLV